MFQVGWRIGYPFLGMICFSGIRFGNFLWIGSDVSGNGTIFLCFLVMYGYVSLWYGMKMYGVMSGG